MPDPLSIGGTALSVVSLGLQVAQGLVTYYSRFKAFDDDIADVSVKAEGLRSILEALQASLLEAESQPSQIPAQVRSSVAACQSSLRKLQELVLKYDSIKVPTTLEDKLRAVKKRALYPFRRDTLRDLKLTLEGLQMNLDSAVNVMNLDVQQRLNAVLSSSFELHKSNSTLIQTEFQKQDRLLVDLTHSAKTHSQKIEKDIRSQNELVVSLAKSTNASSQDIQKSFQYQNEITLSLTGATKSNAIDIQSGFQRQTELLETLLSKVNSLSSSVQSIPVLLATEPTLLASLCNEREGVVEQSTTLTRIPQRRLRKWAGQDISNICSCPRRPQISETRISTRNISTYWSRSARHLPSCPYHAFSERVDTVGAQFTYCTKILGHSIAVAMSLTRGAGGFAISPYLSFVNVVRIKDSPAFMLVNGLFEHDFTSGDPLRKSEEDLRSFLSLFQTRKASPTDINEYGDTLIHAVMYSLEISARYLEGRIENAHKLTYTRTLIGGLVETGSDPHEIDMCKRTILERLPFTYGSLSDGSVMSWVDLVNDFLDMGIPVRPSTVIDNYMGSGISNRIKLLRNSIQASDKSNDLEVPDIMKAIILESEDLLKKTITKSPEVIYEDLGYGRTALHFSVQWPWAVSTLLKAGADINCADKRGYNPLYCACVIECIESVEILLKWDSGLETADYHTCLEEVLRSENEAVLKSFISALIDKRQRLQKLAEISLPPNHPSLRLLQDDKLLDSGASAIALSLKELGVHIEPAILPSLSNRPWTVYHSMPLTAAMAEYLYNAGFHDVDGIDNCSDRPVWRHISTFFCYTRLGQTLELIQWFMSKGVDMLQRHPRRRCAALHAFGANIGERLTVEMRHRPLGSASNARLEHNIFHQLTGTQRNILSEVLNNINEEACSCACSAGGRYVINAVLTGALRIARSWNRVVEPMLFQILAFLESGQDRWYFAPIIIRAMVFDKLGLTHTCPSESDWERQPLSQDEITEIHGEERFLIQELDMLVEEFELLYKEYEGSFTSFMENCWRPRMDEALEKEGTSLDEEELEKIREIGVVLE